MPIVGMDYFYITKEGVRRRDELAEGLVHQAGEGPCPVQGPDPGDDVINHARAKGEVLKCLLVRCLQSKNVFAHVVPQKGDDEDHSCAKLAVADIEWLGHTKVIIKTDNGRAIVALKHRVARHWKSGSPWVTCKQRVLLPTSLNPTAALRWASRLYGACSVR